MIAINRIYYDDAKDLFVADISTFDDLGMTVTARVQGLSLAAIGDRVRNSLKECRWS